MILDFSLDNSTTIDDSNSMSNDDLLDLDPKKADTSASPAPDSSSSEAMMQSWNLNNDSVCSKNIVLPDMPMSPRSPSSKPKRSTRPPQFNDIAAVERTWDQLKNLPQDKNASATLGRNIMSRLQELDDKLSLRPSKAQDEIRHTLLLLLDLIVVAMGPCLVQDFGDELEEFGRVLCVQHGVSASLLAEALVQGVQQTWNKCVGGENEEMSPEDVYAWESVIHVVSKHMLPSVVV